MPAWRAETRLPISSLATRCQAGKCPLPYPGNTRIARSHATANIKKEVASDNAIAFATRLYTECLGREPEEAGLKYWSLGLTNQELTGTQAAQEFFYSDEFLGLNIDDKEYVTRLYKTFMGRDPEEDGFNYWMDKLSVGTTRDEIFDFFSTCQEFTKICEDYSIIR